MYTSVYRVEDSEGQGPFRLNGNTLYRQIDNLTGIENIFDHPFITDDLDWLEQCPDRVNTFYDDVFFGSKDLETVKRYWLPEEFVDIVYQNTDFRVYKYVVPVMEARHYSTQSLFRKDECVAIKVVDKKAILR